jgi:hypothetical protein
MSAPKRWLDDTGNEGRLERELLRRDAEMEPPAGAKDQVWAALIAQLPPSPGDGGGTSGSDAGGGGSGTAGSGATGGALPGALGKAALTSAAGGGLLKSALIGAASALALVTVYSVATPDPPEESAPTAPLVAPSATSAAPSPRAASTSAVAPASSADVAPSAEPRAADRDADRGAATPSPTVAPSSSAALGAEPGAAERESRLREESQRLSEARDALRRGDTQRALALLDDVRQRFPGGVLAQEREALAIEALSRSGKGAEAKARAAAFKDAYPTSPHGARVDALTGDPSPK